MAQRPHAPQEIPKRMSALVDIPLLAPFSSRAHAVVNQSLGVKRAAPGLLAAPALYAQHAPLWAVLILVVFFACGFPGEVHRVIHKGVDLVLVRMDQLLGEPGQTDSTPTQGGELPRPSRSRKGGTRRNS
jgi:hypothetical protein